MSKTEVCAYRERERARKNEREREREREIERERERDNRHPPTPRTHLFKKGENTRSLVQKKCLKPDNFKNWKNLQEGSPKSVLNPGNVKNAKNVRVSGKIGGGISPLTTLFKTHALSSKKKSA